MSRCGVYVENGPPVPVLSGAGLYVEDADHNEVFLMRRAEITLVTRDTSDFEFVELSATYLYNGVVQIYENGGTFSYTWVPSLQTALLEKLCTLYLFLPSVLTIQGDASVREYALVSYIQQVRNMNKVLHNPYRCFAV